LTRTLPLQTEPFDVFVSYARDDSRHAADIDDLLRAASTPKPS
jgi:predicted nucleotidyltransferase